MTKLKSFSVKFLAILFCLFSFSAQPLDSQNSTYQAAMYGAATAVGVAGATELALIYMQDESFLALILPALCGVTAGLAVWKILQAYYGDLAAREKALTKQRLDLEKLIQDLEEASDSLDSQDEKFQQACDLLEALQRKEADRFAQLLLTGLENRLKSLG